MNSVKHENERLNQSHGNKTDSFCQSITIGKSPEEVYSFWRDLTHLPQFMKGISSIDVLSEKNSKWKVKLKDGIVAVWEAEIVSDVPGEMIAWKSTDHSNVKTEGKVWFKPASGKLGTEVTLFMDYDLPGGRATELLTALSGEDPETLTLTNLKRLKALLETGEIPTTEGQASGRRPNHPPIHPQIDLNQEIHH